MNCPKCGAKLEYEDDAVIEFECGTIGQNANRLGHSDICRELCDLRKWREVVLRDAPAFLDNYTIEHVLVADPSDSETVRKAFDAAVRKEME